MSNHIMTDDEIRQMECDMWTPPVLNRVVGETNLPLKESVVYRTYDVRLGLIRRTAKHPVMWFTSTLPDDECTCGCTKARGHLHNRASWVCAACGKLISRAHARVKWPHATHLPEMV